VKASVPAPLRLTLCLGCRTSFRRSRVDWTALASRPAQTDRQSALDQLPAESHYVPAASGMEELAPKGCQMDPCWIDTVGATRAHFARTDRSQTVPVAAQLARISRSHDLGEGRAYQRRATERTPRKRWSAKPTDAAEGPEASRAA
jgi:hypothetical protein